MHMATFKIWGTCIALLDRSQYSFVYCVVIYSICIYTFLNLFYIFGLLPRSEFLIHYCTKRYLRIFSSLSILFYVVKPASRASLSLAFICRSLLVISTVNLYIYSHYLTWLPSLIHYSLLFLLLLYIPRGL